MPMEKGGRTTRLAAGAMWKTEAGRAASAARRLKLAKRLWNWQPHPAQARFFSCPAQMRIAACGRRWGKTEALSLDIATLALDERDCRQLVVAPTDAQARLLGNEVLARLLDAWEWRDSEGQPHPQVAGREITVRQRPSLSVVVTEPNPPAPFPVKEGGVRGGTRPEVSIHFRTAGRDGRSIRGLWAHRVIVDEAARVPDTVLTDVLLPMLTDKGGDYVLASSPFGRRSAYYRLYARGMGEPDPKEPTPPQAATLPKGEGEEIRCVSFQCPTTDNPHLVQAFLQAQREELGESMYAQEFGAQFVDDFGAVFRDDDIDAGIADLPGVELKDGRIVSEPEAGRLYTVGIDWGRKHDYTVVAILDATVKPARLVYLQRWQGTGWETQAKEVAGIVGRFQPWRILTDGNSIGDPVAETLQTEIRNLSPTPSLEGNGLRAGVPTVERFTFSAESKGKLIDRLTLGLSGRALQYPAHRVLLSELRGFEYGAAGGAGRAKMGAKSGAHDDVVIALALAWFAAPECAPPPMRQRILLGSQLGISRRTL